MDHDLDQLGPSLPLCVVVKDLCRTDPQARKLSWLMHVVRLPPCSKSEIMQIRNVSICAERSRP